MDLPPKGKPEFQHWLKHNQAYGPISSVTVMGQTLIIIHDREAARFLLEKNSIKTSSRPHMEFGHNLCGYDNIMGLQPYTDSYRRRRKITNQQLGTKQVVTRYHHIQEVEARRFLLWALNKPEGLIQHIKSETAAIILKTTYGYSIERNNIDPLVSLMERVVGNIATAFVPMAWLVDAIPALQYLPDGFPGTKFKETARQWKKISQGMSTIPYMFVQDQMESRTHQPSYVSRILEQSSGGNTEPELSRDDENDIRWSAGTLYLAGAETTTSALSSFILAMVMFPEVQRIAQEEIDRVTGTDRLPRFQDQGKLPYIEAVIKEVHRWCPVLPMGVPHMSEEDIIYNGYLIPKGAYLLPSVWWLCHDPVVYANPSSFDPGRYLQPRNEPDPRTVMFGFGRRICPGRYFADSSLFITIAQTLAAFTIGKAVDKQGLEIEAKLEVTDSLSSHPKEFPYKIMPRSAKHAELIRSIEAEHPWESDAGLLKWEEG